MPTYTIEYTLSYTMTKEVEADSEDSAIAMVENDPMEGHEHDVNAHGFDVIAVEGEEDGDDE